MGANGLMVEGAFPLSASALKPVRRLRLSGFSREDVDRLRREIASEVLQELVEEIKGSGLSAPEPLSLSELLRELADRMEEGD